MIIGFDGSMMSTLYFYSLFLLLLFSFTRDTYIYEINQELILLVSSNLDVYYFSYANFFYSSFGKKKTLNHICYTWPVSRFNHSIQHKISRAFFGIIFIAWYRKKWSIISYNIMYGTSHIICASTSNNTV